MPKRKILWTVGTTGVVAVGAPTAIITAQQIKTTDSMETRVKEKWADIEKELAATFAGFDIRNASDYQKYLNEQTASQEAWKYSYNTIKNTIGVNGGGYANNLNSLYENIKMRMTSYISNYSRLLQTLIADYIPTNYDHSLSSETFAGVNSVDATIPTVGGPAQFELIGRCTNNKYNSFQVHSISVNGKAEQIPQGISIVLEARLPQGTTAEARHAWIHIDSQSFLNYIDSLAPIKLLNKALSDAKSSDLNVLTNVINELNKFFGPETEPSSAKALLPSFANSFGFKPLFDTIIDPSWATEDAPQQDPTHPEVFKVWESKRSAISTQKLIKNTIEAIISSFEEMGLSFKGHHTDITNDKGVSSLGMLDSHKIDLIKSYIKNADANKQGKQPYSGLVNATFKAIDFDNALPTDLSKLFTEATDAHTIFPEPAEMAKQIRDIGESDLNSLPSIESYISDSNNIGYKFFDEAIEKWNNSARTPDLKDASHKFDPNAPLQFTWKDIIVWLSDEGLLKNGNNYINWPTKNLLQLKDQLISNRVIDYTASSWMDGSVFALSRQNDKFMSVLSKYNISSDDLRIVLSKIDDKKNITELSTISSIEMYDSFSKDLSAEKETEIKALFPLASKEVIEGGFSIAIQRDAENANDIAQQAKFIVDVDTVIQFKLRIKDSENGFDFSNENPVQFRLRADGELFEDK